MMHSDQSALTDAEGRPLGCWVQIDHAEWSALLEREGGLARLAVFSTLTDPDGIYGSPQVYTAWGRPGDDHPLLDICDYKTPDGFTEHTILRKFTEAVG